MAAELRRTSPLRGSARILGAVVILALTACGEPAGGPEREGAGPAPAPAAPGDELHFVGAERCAGCHPQQTARWRGSHHDRAMEVADASTVLGDFGGTSFAHFGSTSEFARRDGRYVVTTEGPDGERAEFEVAYTFGVEPLQQYLIRMPGGRLQALGIAWDGRPAEQGGQRWFSLHPDEPIPPGDVLHWTRPGQNWNAMCAECHSTGVRKGYGLEEDRYETGWAELDVACESCHGRGSAHVAWAESGSPEAGDPGLLVDLGADGASWDFAPGDPIARRSRPRTSDAELETCAPCHSRRSILRSEAGAGERLLDGYRPALLAEGLYHADGQILDEVYVWGSFVQSPMFAAGVRCSDCHDPHSLRIPEPVDAVCSRCHAPEVFGTPAHHHHAAGGEGASCVGCHMPARTYMGVDERRDHSFRVPRPDLTLRIGTPNTCSTCHADRSPEWAAAAVAKWWGTERAARPHYGVAIDAGRRRAPGAGAALAALVRDIDQPAIARATAASLLRENPTPEAADALRTALGDPDPLLRMAAAGAAEVLGPALQPVLTRPALRDPILAVRVTAASALAGLPLKGWTPSDRNALADALAEYRAAQAANADRPEAHVNLGVLYTRLGEADRARSAYETALRLAPWFVPASVNLADLDRQEGKEEDAERVLRRALGEVPEQADLHHALGLTLVRQQRLPEALSELERAAVLAPEEPRYAYAQGLALHSLGETERALEVLAAARRAHPGNRELLVALVTLSRDAGRGEAALRYARDLVALTPDDDGARRLLSQLEAASGTVP